MNFLVFLAIKFAQRWCKSGDTYDHLLSAEELEKSWNVWEQDRKMR